MGRAKLAFCFYETRLETPEIFLPSNLGGNRRKYDGMIREQDKEIHLPNGSEIWLRISENPESLAGEGIRGFVGDEFSLWPEIVWTEFLEATLLDYPDAWACFLGVPKGNNWATLLWKSAAFRPGWKQLHFTSYDNPLLDIPRINEVRENSPADMFSQEYLAEIVDDVGMVFRNVRKCINPALNDSAPQKIDRYYGGLDWAQINDFTACVIVNQAGHVVVVDRFNQLGWQIQYDRVKVLSEMWGVTRGLAELNSIGSPGLEQLQARGMEQWEGFQTTNTSKAGIIQALALAFEQQQIQIPDNPVLIAELESFGAERLPSGKWKYEALGGFHDDTVLALALAWEAKSLPVHLPAGVVRYA